MICKNDHERKFFGFDKPIVPVITGKTDDCTKGKLNRMFKYFRNKKVHMRFEYNNSMGTHQVREWSGIYDSFEIIEVYKSYWQITFRYEGEEVCHQQFDCEWFFTGLGKLEMINSGPRCYFSIERDQFDFYETVVKMANYIADAQKNKKWSFIFPQRKILIK